MNRFLDVGRVLEYEVLLFENIGIQERAEHEGGTKVRCKMSLPSLAEAVVLQVHCRRPLSEAE